MSFRVQSSGVFTVKFEQVSNIVLVFLILCLIAYVLKSIFHYAGTLSKLITHSKPTRHLLVLSIYLCKICFKLAITALEQRQ